MADIENVSPIFLKSLFQGLSTVHIRRSALAPFLLACFFISVPCFVIAIFSPEPLRYWILGIGGTPIAVFSIAALFLLIFDRERLHSEEHLERKQAMQIVEAKGKGLLLSPLDLTNMVNPAPETKKIDDSAGREGVSND